MNRLARLARISVAVTLLIALPVFAQDAEVPRTRTLPGIVSPAFPYAEPEEFGLSMENLERFGDEITAWVANADLVGAELLVVKDRKTVFHEAYGWSDREERRPMERNSLFSIKSMSKPFTATAILMLQDAGKLSLSEPVKSYVSTFAGDDRTTIRHLLSHASGYEGLGGVSGPPVVAFNTLKQWSHVWAAQKPTEPFGEFSYSDFHYAALGYIVEAVSGITVDQFIQGRILEPLGLDDTYTAFSPDARWATRMNSRYQWNDEAADYERYQTNRGRDWWSFYPAAWGLYATAMDYAEFMTLWLNKGHYDGVRLLAEETVEEALRPHALEDGSSGYGYGWFMRAAPNADETPLVFEHGGFDGTLAMAFPADNAMVIFLTHSRGRADLLSTFRNRLAMLGLLEYPGPGMVGANEHKVAEVKLSKEDFAHYIGTYRGTSPLIENAPARLAHVWDDDDRLHIRIGEAGALTGRRSHLVPLGDHRFALGLYRDEHLEAIDPRTTIRFTVEDGEGKALETVAAGEVEFSAQRADPDRIRTEVEAERSRVSIAEIVSKTLEAEGVEAARARHRALRTSRPDSIRFGESLLGTLGFRLLSEGRVEESIAVFEMNAEAFPDAANSYNWLGDAYALAGLEAASRNYERAVELYGQARRNYERAVELAEQQKHRDLATYRYKLAFVRQRLEGR